MQKCIFRLTGDQLQKKTNLWPKIKRPAQALPYSKFIFLSKVSPTPIGSKSQEKGLKRKGYSRCSGNFGARKEEEIAPNLEVKPQFYTFFS